LGNEDEPTEDEQDELSDADMLAALEAYEEQERA
jgi:hypothetical protein